MAEIKWVLMGFSPTFLGVVLAPVISGFLGPPCEKKVDSCFDVPTSNLTSTLTLEDLFCWEDSFFPKKRFGGCAVTVATRMI